MVIAKHIGWNGEFLLLKKENAEGNEEIGKSPWSVPMQFVLSTQAAESLGYHAVTDYKKAAAKLCEWLCKQNDKEWKKIFPVLAAYPYDLFDYNQEDSFLTIIAKKYNCLSYPH